jgi:hypothetical protein
MKEDFLIRAMGFGELARLYSPNVTHAAARNTLRNWIKRNRSLEKELRNCGFVKGNRLLTPLQVGLIIKYLGSP